MNRKNKQTNKYTHNTDKAYRERSTDDIYKHDKAPTKNQVISHPALQRGNLFRKEFPGKRPNIASQTECSIYKISQLYQLLCKIDHTKSLKNKIIG